MPNIDKANAKRYESLTDFANRLGKMVDEYAEIMGEEVDRTSMYHFISGAWDGIVLELRGLGMTVDEQATKIYCPL